jgi:hypothetical protein
VRLELRDIGDRIKVRVEVHRSPVWHSWHIVLRHAEVSIAPPGPGDYQVFFEGTRLASDSGELAVQRPIQDRATHHAFKAKAVDTQTGQVCKAHGGI